MGRLIKKLLSYPIWSIPFYLVGLIIYESDIGKLMLIVLTIIVALTCYGSYRHKQQERKNKKVREK